MYRHCFDETSFPVNPIPDRHPDKFSIINLCIQPVSEHARDPVTTEPSKRQKVHHPIIQTAGGQKEQRIPVHPNPLNFISLHITNGGYKPQPNLHQVTPLSCLTEINTPITYQDALKGKHAHHWFQAI